MINLLFCQGEPVAGPAELHHPCDASIGSIDDVHSYPVGRRHLALYQPFDQWPPGLIDQRTHLHPGPDIGRHPAVGYRWHAQGVDALELDMKALHVLENIDHPPEAAPGIAECLPRGIPLVFRQAAMKDQTTVIKSILPLSRRFFTR